MKNVCVIIFSLPWQSDRRSLLFKVLSLPFLRAVLCQEFSQFLLLCPLYHQELHIAGCYPELLEIVTYTFFLNYFGASSSNNNVFAKTSEFGRLLAFPL